MLTLEPGLFANCCVGTTPALTVADLVSTRRSDMDSLAISLRRMSRRETRVKMNLGTKDVSNGPWEMIHSNMGT